LTGPIEAQDDDAKKKPMGTMSPDPDAPIDFGRIYGTGAALGFAPDQVDRCSFWQLGVCVDGFNKANGAEDKIEPPTDAEFDALLEDL
jgi:hypothetical protein